MKDQFGRTIDYMRISITDRCNLRCRYCMPEGCAKVPMDQILTYEEIERICRVAAGLGIRKVRLTGGEPLVRHGCTQLVKKLKQTTGIEEVALTTNGQDLSRHMDDLKASGIDGINISLDTLDPDRYTFITGGGCLNKTLQGIDAALGSVYADVLWWRYLAAESWDDVARMVGYSPRRCAELQAIAFDYVDSVGVDGAIRGETA